MKIVLYKDNPAQTKIEYTAYSFPDGNPEEWRGITIYGEFLPEGTLDHAALGLLGKARVLADRTNDKAQLLLIGGGLIEGARDYYANGADRVFVYDDPTLKDYDEERFFTTIMHFINNYKPAVLCFRQSSCGELLCSRVIDQLKTILPFEGDTQTADRYPAAIEPDISRLGELVICEIP